MPSNDGSRPVVLIVDDEEDVADTYALRIQSDYETRVAYGGEEALAKFDDVDTVLLDRRMPDIHGDNVLSEMRDSGFDGAVIMLTAVDPDLNILEMDFDDYLCKPIFRESLLETLNQHVDTRDRGSETLEDFLSSVSKLDVLEAELSVGERQSSEQYQQLKARLEQLAPRVEKEVDDLDALLETYRSIEREST